MASKSMPADLNSIVIDVSKLRMQLAYLQQDGFTEVGLGDFLVFMHAYLHADDRLVFMQTAWGALVPREAPPGAGPKTA